MKTIPIRPPQVKLKLPAAPTELEKPERALWRKVVESYDFGTDSAALAILESSLIARGRARRCREIMDRDGELTFDRFGQSRQHPLLPAERGAQGNFIAGMRSLGLSLGEQL
jgi:hypothetical protein